eukprot:5282581-Heterocapsa_arctica.AAC.1
MGKTGNLTGNQRTLKREAAKMSNGYEANLLAQVVAVASASTVITPGGPTAIPRPPSAALT